MPGAKTSAKEKFDTSLLHFCVFCGTMLTEVIRKFGSPPEEKEDRAYNGKVTCGI